jgi:CHAT domain-containing protein
MILGPPAKDMAGKRLLIVADGALQYIPFGALPEPRQGSAHPLPLMSEHVIVSLPSIAILKILRQEEAARKEPAKTVAVLADPVFAANDGRLARKNSPASSEVVAQRSPDAADERLTRSVRDAGLLHLPRLPYTRKEAEEILAMSPRASSMGATDFNANRTQALDPKLGSYKFVHFATHGLIDNQHPELSGLVLSLFNEQGKPVEGFLPLEDIYNLNLPVDMVVLSACDTGLGKEISGEGLLGLTRGFMYAGASRVVASLWKVNDVATAELMQRFYRGILHDQLPAAAALRQAQLQMLQTRWSSPYYWAAFQIHGEWK